MMANVDKYVVVAWNGVHLAMRIIDENEAEEALRCTIS